MAFSSTRFLFGFLTRPKSQDRPRSLGVVSSCRNANPGERATLKTAGAPSSGRRTQHKLAIYSRRLELFSSGTMNATVNEVVVYRRTIISCLKRLSTSAANKKLTAFGGSSVLCSVKGYGNGCNAVHVWHVSDTWSMDLPKYKAKIFHFTTSCSWCFVVLLS